MFDLLKKKLGNFAQKVKTKIDKKETQAPPEEEAQQPEPVKEAEPEKKATETPRKDEEKITEPTAAEKPAPIKETPEEPKPEQPIEETTTQPAEKPVLIQEKPKPVQEPTKIQEQEEQNTIEKTIAIEEPEPIEKPVEDKRELKAKVSITGKLKAAITGTVKLEEKDLKDLLWELELALLEADVEQTTSEEICREIKQKLTEKELPKGKSIEDTIKKEIAKILEGMMQTEKRNISKEAKEKKDKPYKILFLGPNGAGKTTSMAKLTHYMKSQGLSVIWAAGDTFRAASIEQLEKHAQKLDVRVIKHQYGADPAAVAFDTVKAAKSKKTDIVMIDSAGRQETNKNLIGELQKVVRVVQPDLKIYVGEAYTGQAILHQAKEYDKAIGIDGFILTKIDCDSKGGTTISLLYKIKKPILFVGTGQEYEDLQEFEPSFVLERIIS